MTVVRTRTLAGLSRAACAECHWQAEDGGSSPKLARLRTRALAHVESKKHPVTVSIISSAIYEVKK